MQEYPAELLLWDCLLSADQSTSLGLFDVDQRLAPLAPAASASAVQTVETDSNATAAEDPAACHDGFAALFDSDEEAGEDEAANFVSMIQSSHEARTRSSAPLIPSQGKPLLESLQISAAVGHLLCRPTTSTAPV